MVCEFRVFRVSGPAAIQERQVEERQLSCSGRNRVSGKEGLGFKEGELWPLKVGCHVDVYAVVYSFPHTILSYSLLVLDNGRDGRHVWLARLAGSSGFSHSKSMSRISGHGTYQIDDVAMVRYQKHMRRCRIMAYLR